VVPSGLSSVDSGGRALSKVKLLSYFHESAYDKYHSSSSEKGLTPPVIGCSGNDEKFAVQCG